MDKECKKALRGLRELAAIGRPGGPMQQAAERGARVIEALITEAQALREIREAVIYCGSEEMLDDFLVQYRKHITAKRSNSDE